ncbi:hypothetical protein FQN51_005121 [Onygenales sp. PD_10]|nr:hypothetical protein FQN51_005121 [Onygenales sp. PD_10]
MEPEISRTGLTVLSDPESAVIDIVFVHGLQGDPRHTWTWEPARAQIHTEPNGTGPKSFFKFWSSGKRAEGASADTSEGNQGDTVEASPVFWPRDLLAADFPTARIITFGYDSTITGGYRPVNQGNLFTYARNLLYELVILKKHSPKRHLVFIAHSLGGIIVKEALRRSEIDLHKDVVGIFESTAGILFFGTPHRGSEHWASFAEGIAKVASRLLGFNVNHHIIRSLLPSASELEQCRESFTAQWVKRGSKMTVRTFQESRGVTGIRYRGLDRLIVPPDSSALDHPDQRAYSLDADHRQMVKFKGKKDKGYRMVNAEIEILISKAEHDPDNALFPYPSNPGFIGRSATIDKLKKLFIPAFAQTGITYQVRAGLFGLGGIGKTQIALAFAYWAQTEYPSLSVFWIHASTPERFRQGAAQIVQECKIPGHDDPKADVAQALKLWLEEKSREPWLMILDNADDAQIFFPSDDTLASTHQELGESDGSTQLRPYIPTSTRGAILVTSRNKKAGLEITNNSSIISVDRMDEKECSDLIRTKLEDDSLSPDHITCLVERLEYMPLAIVQAVCFIQENRCEIARYIQLLDSGDNTLVETLSQPFKADGRDNSVPNAVAATWIVSFDQIRKQYREASDIFAHMCFFDRQGIPREFLTCPTELLRGIDSPMGQLELEKHLGTLKAFSFISEGNDGTITIHRLVHLVMRRWLQAKGESGRWAGKALATVEYLMPIGWDRKICEEYFPHVTAVLNLEGPLDDLVKSSLLSKTANFLTLKGRNDHAEELQHEALALAKRALTEDHPKTLISMDDLVQVYFNSGQYEKAERLGIEVVKRRAKVLRQKHQDTLGSLDVLAEIWLAQHKFKEGEEYRKHVLDMRTRFPGLEDRYTLGSMDTLALIWCYQGQLNEAEGLYSLVVEVRKGVFGSDDLDTLSSMHELALTWRHQGRFVMAENLQREVLEAEKRVLTEEHINTLRSMYDLAWTWKMLGFNDKAMHLMRECCCRQKKVMGEDHHHTVRSAEYLREWTEERSSNRRIFDKLFWRRSQAAGGERCH